MLLKIKKPTCHKKLSTMHIFIYKILRYASKSRRPLDKEDFANELGEYGKWFINIKEDSVVQGIKALFSRSSEECIKMRQAFYNDIMCIKAEIRHNLKFDYPDLNDETKIALKAFLTPFYTYILSSLGFPIFEGEEISKLKVQDIRKAYVKENIEICCMCPACLDKINWKKEGEDITAQLDHYLPKKWYPSLVVSSENLVPVCKDCNSTDVKGEYNPIKRHELGEITKLFLPYKDCGLDHIVININGSSGNRVVKLQPSGYEANSNVKVENFEQTYKLNNRWTGRLDYIHNYIIRSIVVDIEVDELEPDDEIILKSLNKEIYKARKYERKTPDSYLQRCYGEWLKDYAFKELCQEVKIQIDESKNFSNR